MAGVDHETIQKGQKPSEDYGLFLSRLRKSKNVFVGVGPVVDIIEYDMRWRLKKSCSLSASLLQAVRVQAKKVDSQRGALQVFVSEGWLASALSSSYQKPSQVEITKLQPQSFFTQAAGALCLAALLKEEPRKRRLFSKALKAAVEVVQHGQRAVLISKVGIDSSTQSLRQQLRKDRVFGRLVLSDHLPTSEALFIRLQDPLPDLKIHSLPPKHGSTLFASHSLLEKEIDPSFFKYAKLLYCDSDSLISISSPALSKVMSQAKRAGAKVALSLETTSLRQFLHLFKKQGQKMLLELLCTKVDYLFVSNQVLPILEDLTNGSSFSRSCTLSRGKGFIQSLATSFSMVVVHEQETLVLITPYQVYSVAYREFLGEELDKNPIEKINAVVAQAIMAGDSIVQLKNTLKKAFISN